jgi:hypothetical protein
VFVVIAEYALRDLLAPPLSNIHCYTNFHALDSIQSLGTVVRGKIECLSKTSDGYFKFEYIPHPIVFCIVDNSKVLKITRAMCMFVWHQVERLLVTLHCIIDIYKDHCPVVSSTKHMAKQPELICSARIDLCYGTRNILELFNISVETLHITACRALMEASNSEAP